MVDGDPTRRVLGGRYRLDRRIGAGGMGEVYEAEDLQLSRRLAIKLIASARPAEETAERFRREAMAAAQLAHPHIAAVQDYVAGRGDDPAFIVMELLEGESLDARLSRGALPVDEALEIAAQAANALAAAHAVGIVHRDIKPANLFLVRTAAGPLVKILDFGIAKLTGARALTRTDEVVGTVEYMAPEQAMGDAEIGPAADVFSLGVVLYLMLSGALPHAGSTVREILAGLFRGDLVPLASRTTEVPPAVDALVSHALAIDPSARYRSGAELEAAIAAVRGGQPLPAPASPERSGALTAVERVPRPPAAAVRSRAPVRWIALAAVVVAGAGIAWLRPWAGSSNPPPSTAPSVLVDAAPALAPDAAIAMAPADVAEMVSPDAGLATAPRDAAVGAAAPRPAAPPTVHGIWVARRSWLTQAPVTSDDTTRFQTAHEAARATVERRAKACYTGEPIVFQVQADHLKYRVNASGKVIAIAIERGGVGQREGLATSARVRPCLERLVRSLSYGAWTDLADAEAEAELSIYMSTDTWPPRPLKDS